MASNAVTSSVGGFDKLKPLLLTLTESVGVELEGIDSEVVTDEVMLVSVVDVL